MDEGTGASTCTSGERAGDAARRTRVSRVAGLDGVSTGRGARRKVEETNSMEKSDEGERGGVQGAVDSLGESFEGLMGRTDGTKI